MRLWADFREAVSQSGGDSEDRRARNSMLGCVVAFAAGLVVIAVVIVLRVIHAIINSFL